MKALVLYGGSGTRPRRPSLRPVRRVADRKGHDLRYALDGTLIRDELGHEPAVPFEQGLAETVGSAS